MKCRETLAFVFSTDATGIDLCRPYENGQFSSIVTIYYNYIKIYFLSVNTIINEYYKHHYLLLRRMNMNTMPVADNRSFYVRKYKFQHYSFVFSFFFRVTFFFLCCCIFSSIPFVRG